MAFNYGNIAALARAQLIQFGQTVQLVDVSAGVYDPATGQTTVPPDATVNRQAAIFDFGEGEIEKEGSLIQVQDKKAIMEAGIEPSTEDKVIDANGVTYSIVAVSAIAPAGTVVVYKLHLRRG